MEQASHAQPRYEQRLVIFLDILGFREIVADTVCDARALGAVLAAIDSISELRKPEIHQTKQVSQFSDSIVVSFAISEASAVFWLVNDVALTIITLTEQGYLLRGGITVGDLIHTDRHLVGPALVRAYEMESKEAINPRVLFDPQILVVARQYHAAQNTPEQEAQYVRDLLSQDVDGKLYFDFVSWSSVVGHAGASANLYGKYLLRIGEMSAQRLRHNNLSVVRKGQWLLQHYLRAVDDIAAVRPDHQFYAENVELCSSIGQFPRYADVAKTAQERLTV